MWARPQVRNAHASQLLCRVPHRLGPSPPILRYAFAPPFQILDSTDQSHFIIRLDGTSDGAIVGPNPSPGLGVLLGCELAGSIPCRCFGD